MRLLLLHRFYWRLLDVFDPWMPFHHIDHSLDMIEKGLNELDIKVKVATYE